MTFTVVSKSGTLPKRVFQALPLNLGNLVVFLSHQKRCLEKTDGEQYANENLKKHTNIMTFKLPILGTFGGRSST